MSVSAPSEVSPPQKLSIVEAFKTAPTLVKVLAASFYLPALLMLGYAFLVAAGVALAVAAFDSSAMGTALAAYVLVLGLLCAMVSFLLGKGIARGARGTWIVAVVLYGIALLLSLLSILADVTVTSILDLVISVATLALLLTPVVRLHCAKK